MSEEEGTIVYCDKCQTTGDCCGNEKPIGWIEVTNEPTE